MRRRCFHSSTVTPRKPMLSKAMWFAAAAMMAIGAPMAGAQPAKQAAQDKLVHLNQIQVIGSHNSYHTGFAPSEHKFLEINSPKTLRGLDYKNDPLGGHTHGGG